MSKEKIDALNEVLVNLESCKKTIESYEVIKKIDISIEIIEIVKALIYWEEEENDILSLKPLKNENYLIDKLIKQYKN